MPPMHFSIAAREAPADLARLHWVGGSPGIALAHRQIVALLLDGEPRWEAALLGVGEAGHLVWAEASAAIFLGSHSVCALDLLSGDLRLMQHLEHPLETARLAPGREHLVVVTADDREVLVLDRALRVVKAPRQPPDAATMAEDDRIMGLAVDFLVGLDALCRRYDAALGGLCQGPDGPAFFLTVGSHAYEATRIDPAAGVCTWAPEREPAAEAETMGFMRGLLALCRRHEVTLAGAKRGQSDDAFFLAVGGRAHTSLTVVPARGLAELQ